MAEADRASLRNPQRIDVESDDDIRRWAKELGVSRVALIVG
jgi:hypothetical protein